MKEWLWAALIPAVVFVAGCGQAPTDKLAATEKAVEDARTAGSANYVAEDFARLEGMLTNAKNEMAEQDSKFGFLRDYGKAEELLTSAQTEATRVTAEAGKKKEEAKQAALQAQQAAQESVKATQALMAKAPVGKDRAAVEAIKADAQGLTSSLMEVQTAIDAADYQAAQAKAKAINDKSEMLAAEIRGALAKVAAGKAARKAPTKTAKRK